MTILPPELPSFQRFVESTKFSLGQRTLPERCSNCANNALPYEVVDLHRNNGDYSPSMGGPQDGLFWAAAVSDDSSTASTATCDSSSCSCDDLDDHSMSESTPSSPSSVCDEPHEDAAKAKPRRAYATKKKYLTEQQRYEIVCRVLSGEKQAHVARDYGVTRAAVSYLLKHHSEIMHRVLTMHANCCLQRAAATAVAMDTSE